MRVPLFAHNMLRVDVPGLDSSPTMRADCRIASAAKWLTTRKAGILAPDVSEMQFFVADQTDTIAAESSLAERRLCRLD